MDKQTKEQLLVELTKIRQSHAGWVEGDERRKKEFAKAFSWYEKQAMYHYDREIKLPSWEEIFVEIGKLLAAKNFMDFKGNLSELECKVNNLEEKIRKEIHPNL